MRYALRLQHYLALKNEIFSSTLRGFYKNAQFFTTVRLALKLFLEPICFKIIAERFALLKSEIDIRIRLIFEYRIYSNIRIHIRIRIRG
jgi:hypothetical protein